jgi:precorrin-6Y C5,15-methyltransferase (decarboxylating)
MTALNHPGRWLSIIGIGEDGLDGLSPAARRLVEGAEVLIGGERHLTFMPPGPAQRVRWPSPLTNAIPDLLGRRGQRVVVLASGDPFHFGVGVTLARSIPSDEMLTIPAPSAFSLAAARLGWALQDVATLSLHGRALEGVIPHIQPGRRIIALTSDGTTAENVARLLCERGFGPARMIVLEAMGGARENMRETVAERFDLSAIDPLNVLAVDCVAGPMARPVPLAAGLDDAFFENDGQLTKREVRAITLSALAPQAGERLWDIGLGAGSIAIEWLLRHPSLHAFGIEENADRAARAARNAAALGVPHLAIKEGSAPQALIGLPTPDAIFIGGGIGDPGVFEAARAALRPGGRLVANGVSLETEAILLDAFAKFGGDLVRIGIERVAAVGAMHGWRPAMPVTQWRWIKPS